MATTDPTNVGPSLSFITPEDFRRDEDADMRTVPSESDELEYGTPIQNDNNPGEGPLAQNDIEPNDERYNEFHAEGVPGQGWDGTGFDVAPETQA
jgi:hypothetical protein